MLNLFPLLITRTRLYSLRLSIIFSIIYAGSIYCQSVSEDSQTKTNLEIFYKLADSAANNALQNIPKTQKNITLDLNLGNAYTILGNQVFEMFHSSGKNIVKGLKKDSALVTLNFVIDQAKVTYGELFRKRLFGDFYTSRKLLLSGNYVLYSPELSVHNFNYSFSDTVDANTIKELENVSFPFTQGQLPAEPLFSSMYEPVIAVGVAALTVILFFTVRSK